MDALLELAWERLPSGIRTVDIAERVGVSQPGRGGRAAGCRAMPCWRAGNPVVQGLLAGDLSTLRQRLDAALPLLLPGLGATAAEIEP